MADATGRFTEATFLKKCTRVLKKTGKEVIEKALWLYFTLKRPDVPARAKATILGALAYFVSPLDLIPDAIPVAGYTDDAVALAAAVAAVAMYIDATVRKQAEDKMRDWGVI